MAIFALTDGSLVINSVDLSDHAKSISTDVEVVELRTTAMGDTWETVIGGLKSGQLQVEFYNDHAASSVDATLWAALGTVVTFVFKTSSGAVSATNPSYSGSILIGGHTVGGGHGDTPMVSRSYTTSGAITRAVA